MAGESLFNPGNRSLSGLTHDLGLYGGQPAPEFTIGQPADPAASTSASIQDADAPAVSSPPAAPAPAAPIPDEQSAAPADEASSASAPATQVQSSAPASDTIAATGTEPHGGSASPEVLASLIPHSASPDSVASPAASSDGLASPTAAEDATSLIAQQLGGGAIALDAGSLALSGLAHGTALSGIGDGAAGHVITTLTDTVSSSADELSAVAIPAVEATAPVVQDVATFAEPAIATTADAVTAPVVEATDAATATAEPVTTAIETAPDEAFSGTDPAAGVGTLVDMVNSADQFAVSDASAAAPEPATGSIVDDLIGDEAAGAALLGDADHTSDGTHTDSDTDHIVGGL